MNSYQKALFIVQTLQKAGYIAYFAGGWVRDFLLQHPSDDIDIATNAPPEKVASLFPKTVPIGIAFGILLVVIEQDAFEVATFRKESDYVDGRHPSHIEYSDALQDAKRRDFTINGMFYDPIKKEILDFVGGQKDLHHKILRAIGDPKIRFQEDRLRMIRAVRLSTRFGFTIERATKEAILSFSHELFLSVAVERIWQELVKMNAFPHFKEGLLTLFELHLLPAIFPLLQNLSQKEMENRIAVLDDFPEKVPLIAKILELFPFFSLEEEIELCKFLKLSHKEMDFIFVRNEAKRLVEKTGSMSEWAHFYAKKESDLALQIWVAHLPSSKRAIFLSQNEQRKASLQKQILRIQKKDPILKAQHLIDLGITPGKEMGLLLKEGERVAIEEHIEDPLTIIQVLKKTPLWPANR